MYSENKIYVKLYIVMALYVDVIWVHTYHGNNKHKKQYSFTPGEGGWMWC